MHPSVLLYGTDDYGVSISILTTKISYKFPKEEHILKVMFFAMSVQKNQFKFQNTAFLFVTIQIWIYFYFLHNNMAEKKRI